MSKTDRRIVKTKQAIHEALIYLLSVKNFEQITIQAIAERANVNRGTIYLHYADKYDLLDKCIEEELNQMLAICSLKNRKDGDQKLDVYHSLEPMFFYFEEHYLFYSSMLHNRGISCFHERLMQMVRNGMYQHIQTEDTNPPIHKEIVAQFMASAFVGVVEWWITNRMPYSPKIMAQQVWTIFQRGNFPVNKWW